MDTRTRVLVVEDEADYRNAWLDILEDDGGFLADGVASVADAIAAAERCTYHVALVDIMLNGPDDVSNRDGIDVVEFLRYLKEGTQSIVLSGQMDDLPLVRDATQEHGASRYLFKREVREKGKAFLVQAVKDAAARAPGFPGSDWKTLANRLSGGAAEEAFVYKLLRSLDIGGADNLRTSLLRACKHLVPLMPEEGPPQGISRESADQAFSGKFWSKGQRTAVEILVYDSAMVPENLEAQYRISQRNVLDSREKGRLTITVLTCPELDRNLFRRYDETGG